MLGHTKKEKERIAADSRKIDDELKYSFFILLLAVIHLFFSVFYYFFNLLPLIIYNIASCIFYLALYKLLLKQKKYFQIMNIILVEVAFFASSSTLLLGWDFGYMIYFLSLVPIVFYLLFTNPRFYGNLKLPLLYSVFICIIFILVKTVSFHTVPPYKDFFPDGVISFMYLFNSLLVFLFEAFFSLLFVFEILHMQSALKAQNIRLDTLASLDPLTKLFNRRSMEQHLNHTMEAARTAGTVFSVIIADIDDFKKINDTYGHDFGDKVLSNVSNILKSQMRDEDYVCRWGGEEFLLLIHANKEIAKTVGERIRSEIEKSIVTDSDNSVSVTMTFGVMGYIPGYSIDKLISLADENLYKGKQNGKNQVVA
ncbi:MAG: GGDEF domain-containing protein [Lachnospiraceae bacterium]|nr:GGDEF domain-containing protein [Lachnospiraceae bacterium]